MKKKTIEIHVKSYDEIKEALFETMQERDVLLAKIAEALKLIDALPFPFPYTIYTKKDEFLEGLRKCLAGDETK